MFNWDLMVPGPSKRRVKTADRIMEIFDVVKSQEGALASDVTEETGLSSSTVHVYLSTLNDLGFLIKKGKKYHISLKFLDYGGYAKTKHPLYPESKNVLKTLAQNTKGSIWLIVEEHGRAVYLDKEIGDEALETNGRQGKRGYLHQMAAGKCILAHLPEANVLDIIEQHGLPQATASTITDKSTLFEELDEIRNQGFSYNMGEEIDGISAVSAPIFQDSDVLAGISISCPTSRFLHNENKTKYRQLVVEAAETLTLHMDHQTDKHIS